MDINLCRKCPDFAAFAVSALATGNEKYDKYSLYCYRNFNYGFHYTTMTKGDFDKLRIGDFRYNTENAVDFAAWMQFKKGQERDFQLNLEFEPPDNCNYRLEWLIQIDK